MRHASSFWWWYFVYSFNPCLVRKERCLLHYLSFSSPTFYILYSLKVPLISQWSHNCELSLSRLPFEIKRRVMTWHESSLFVLVFCVKLSVTLVSQRLWVFRKGCMKRSACRNLSYYCEMMKIAVKLIGNTFIYCCVRLHSVSSHVTLFMLRRLRHHHHHHPSHSLSMIESQHEGNLSTASKYCKTFALVIHLLSTVFLQQREGKERLCIHEEEGELVVESTGDKKSHLTNERWFIVCVKGNICCLQQTFLHEYWARDYLLFFFCHETGELMKTIHDISPLLLFLSRRSSRCVGSIPFRLPESDSWCNKYEKRVLLHDTLI